MKVKYLKRLSFLNAKLLSEPKGTVRWVHFERAKSYIKRKLEKYK